MAHNININNGKASFFTKKEKAWHGLGQVVENAPNSSEAIKLAGLDFEVGLTPLYTDINNTGVIFVDEQNKLKNNFATYRKDTGSLFGVVGSRYTPVQNSEAFDFFDSIVGEGEAIYETAGALGQGETIFITAKLPDYIKVSNEDVIEKYLLLTMSHDGKGAIQAMFTPVRVVCNNTLKYALSNRMHSNKISIRHSANAPQKLKEAHKLMGITNQLTNELTHIYQSMSKVRITDIKLREYIENIYLTKEEIIDRDTISTRKKNIINSIFEFAHVGVGQDIETAKGTIYGAYQAVTGYYQNVQNYKDKDAKFVNIMQDGNATKFMEKAFNSANLMLN